MWGKDSQALLTQRPEIKTYLAQHCTFTHFKKYLSQDQIIKYIQDGHLFGFVECDIEVPDHFEEYFLEMTPIFKNVDVCLDDVRKFMQEYAKRQNIKDVPSAVSLLDHISVKNWTFNAIIKMVFRTQTCHHKHLHCCRICT